MHGLRTSSSSAINRNTHSRTQGGTRHRKQKQQQKWQHWEVPDSPPATRGAAAQLRAPVACLAGAQPGPSPGLWTTTRNAHAASIVAATPAPVLRALSPPGLARPTASAATLALVSHVLPKEAQVPSVL